MTRRIDVRAVRKRHNTDRIAISAAGDFMTAGKVSAPEGLVLPYCIDFTRMRTIFVAGARLQEVQAAPFYYLHLRNTADVVVSVPIEHGPYSGSPFSGDPVFLFSPGRCGSTMLSRVLAEANVPAVSEPDFYTQMASVFWSSRHNPLRKPFLTAMWNMSDDLSAALGMPPVVKLRAECARAPELFVRDPHARTLVMLRRFEDWARSTAQVFGAGPGKMVRKYLSAARCWGTLNRVSRCRLLHYKDWTADPVAAARDLGRFLGVTIPAEAVQRAMAINSQAGTPLAGRCRPGWEAKFDAAMHLWHSPRLGGARARLEIPGLGD